jgi:hypothetical protein
MCLIYPISFLFSLGGIFGVGHLMAGAPSKALAYFLAGLIWMGLMTVIVAATALTALIWLAPIHLVFAHLCAVNALQCAKQTA